MNENRKFAWMLAGTCAATVGPNLSFWFFPALFYLFGMPDTVAHFLLVPLALPGFLMPATPMIWSLMFARMLAEFGRRALWLLPAAPFAFLPIIVYFARPTF